MFEISAYGDSTWDSAGNHRTVFGRERHQDDPAREAEPPEDSHKIVNKIHAFPPRRGGGKGRFEISSPFFFFQGPEQQSDRNAVQRHLQKSHQIVPLVSFYIFSLFSISYCYPIFNFQQIVFLKMYNKGRPF